MKTFLLAFALLAGCSVGDTGGGGGGGGGAQPDAAVLQNGGGSGSGSSSSNACTGALYDPCTSNAQCMSGNCHVYSGQGIQVCTATCTPGDNTPCGAGTCNNMAICKPNAANTCTR
jgi:hypothetical protein